MYKLNGKTFLPQRLQNTSMNYRLYLFSNLQIQQVQTEIIIFFKAASPPIFPISVNPVP